MLGRQLNRAIDQLDRLQRRRKGEPVPPSINVDVSAAVGFAKQSHRADPLGHPIRPLRDGYPARTAPAPAAEDPGAHEAPPS